MPLTVIKNSKKEKLIILEIIKGKKYSIEKY